MQKKKLRVKAIVFDQGNTLIMDPFYKIIQEIAPRLKKILLKYQPTTTEKEIINAWKKANSEVDYPFISHFMHEEPIVFKMLEILRLKAKEILQTTPKILQIYRRRLPFWTKKISDPQKIKKF